MNARSLGICAVAISIVSSLNAVRLELNVQNKAQGKMTVEIYEKLENQAKWDVELAPAWEGRIFLNKNASTTYVQDLEEGEYQISAYRKTRTKSLPKTVNFTIKGNDNDIKPLNVIVNDDGVSE